MNTRVDREILISIDGKEYSLKETSKRFNVPYNLILRRYNVGIRGKDIIHYKYMVVKIKGRNMNIKEVYEKYKIPLTDLLKRYGAGIRNEEILKDKKIEKGELKGNFYGKMLTIKELKKMSNLSEASIKRRIEKNLKDEDLLTRNKNKKFIKVNGKSISIRKISRDYKIPYRIVSNRFSVNKKSFYYLISRPMEGARKYDVGLNKKLTKNEIAQIANISATTVHKRIENKITGIDLLKKTQRGTREIKIEILGKEYTFKTASKHFGIPKSSIINRYSNGKRGIDLLGKKWKEQNKL